MCEPKAEQPAIPMRAARARRRPTAASCAAACRQRARRGLPPSIDMRNASGSMPRGMGELVDEAFGEEAIFALRRAAHVAGVRGGRTAHGFDRARRGSSKAERRRRARLRRARPVRSPVRRAMRRAEAVAGRDAHLPGGGDPALAGKRGHSRKRAGRAAVVVLACALRKRHLDGRLERSRELDRNRESRRFQRAARRFADRHRIERVAPSPSGRARDRAPGSAPRPRPGRPKRARSR